MMLLVCYAGRIYTQLENMHITAVCMPPSFDFELVNGAISNMGEKKIDDRLINAYARHCNSINDSLFSLVSFQSYPNLLV